MHYHLELTGYVGRENFNSTKTDNLLRQYPGKHVDVLVDSTGGSLAHGLSVAGAFRNHGDVTVFLRGMCASAATIAAMGAKKICIDPNAFFLVHKVMISFFDWSMHNADSLQKYIEALQAQKKDLETLDSSVAATYAARCKKPVNELLELMKEGKWLTAQQALDWGFVDEVTSSQDTAGNQARMTRAQADAFAAQGLPLPPIDIYEPENEKSSFFTELKNLFKNTFAMDSQKQDPVNSPAQSPQTSPANPQNSSEDIVAMRNEIEELRKENAKLKEEKESLAKSPGAETSQAVSSPQNGPAKPDNDGPFASFLATSKSAGELFDALP